MRHATLGLLVAVLFVVVMLAFVADMAARPIPVLPKPWLLPLRESPGDRIRVLCDLETGNLVYVYGGGQGGAGLAVVPGGCR